MKRDALSRSRALWNRRRLDLESDETLAQLMDRGELEAWRELYALARSDAGLRERMHRIVLTVPLSLPYFWLSALAAMGDAVDYDTPLAASESSILGTPGEDESG